MGCLTEREARMVVVRARAHNIAALCEAELVALRAGDWWLAEQIRWSIAHRCVEGGGESD